MQILDLALEFYSLDRAFWFFLFCHSSFLFLFLLILAWAYILVNERRKLCRTVIGQQHLVVWFYLSMRGIDGGKLGVMRIEANVHDVGDGLELDLPGCIPPIVPAALGGLADAAVQPPLALAHHAAPVA